MGDFFQRIKSSLRVKTAITALAVALLIDGFQFSEQFALEVIALAGLLIASDTFRRIGGAK